MTTESQRDDPSPAMHVAIVAWNALPAAFPSAGRAVGGMETFAWRFSQALARLPNVRVSLLVRHTRHPPQNVVDGVRLVAFVEPLRNLRREVSLALDVRRAPLRIRIKRFQPRLLWQVPLLAAAGLWNSSGRRRDRLRKLLQRVRPSAWLVLGCSEESALVIATAEEQGEPSLLWIRSNADLDERFFAESEFVNEYNVSSAAARTCLNKASEVICQAQWQTGELARLVGRSGHLIPNPVLADEWAVGNSDQTGREYVLWVGRYDTHHKRPALAVEIARLLPQVRFVMIINAGNAEVQRQIRAALPPNVEVRDFVPRDRMPDLFSRARLLLSTGASRHEGFPNVLLEAAAAGVPIVSLEDFGGFLARSGAGVCVGDDLNEAAKAIGEILSDESTWNSLARAGQEYVRHRHSMQQIVQQFAQLAQRTIAHPRRSAAAPR